MTKKRQFTKKQIKIKNLIKKQIDKYNFVNFFKFIDLLNKN